MFYHPEEMVFEKIIASLEKEKETIFGKLKVWFFFV